jgi:glycosyltransferase involved in cell wall biosynthesis
MTFSIITPTLNSREFLEETLQSVLSQERADIEYIIVDGGSTDGTVDVIKSHAASDNRIRWHSEPDEGIADAFNKGIALARGEIIGIINSDDSYIPGALAAVAEAYRSHPECDVFHGDMLRLQGDRVLFMLKPSDVQRQIWHEMPLNHPATFVTARAYSKVGGFDAKVRIAMDYDLMLRLYMSGCRFHYIGQPLAAMRYGGASDAKRLDGLREVREISIREGYPAAKAWFWFVYKVTISTIKNMLRSLGLFSLMRLHPKFRKV